jgi:hypothetical protein
MFPSMSPSSAHRVEPPPSTTSTRPRPGPITACVAGGPKRGGEGCPVLAPPTSHQASR